MSKYGEPWGVMDDEPLEDCFGVSESSGWKMAAFDREEQAQRACDCVTAMEGVSDPKALVEEHAEMRRHLATIDALVAGGVTPNQHDMSGAREILARIRAREEGEER